jgi:hypothetical protein
LIILIKNQDSTSSWIFYFYLIYFYLVQLSVIIIIIILLEIVSLLHLLEILILLLRSSTHIFQNSRSSSFNFSNLKKVIFNLVEFSFRLSVHQVGLSPNYLKSFYIFYFNSPDYSNSVRRPCSIPCTQNVSLLNAFTNDFIPHLTIFINESLFAMLFFIIDKIDFFLLATLVEADVFVLIDSVLMRGSQPFG